MVQSDVQLEILPRLACRGLGWVMVLRYFLACIGTIVVVWMVTSWLVLHARLILRMLPWRDLAIQRAARHGIGSLTGWKDLIPNRTQEFLLQKTCQNRCNEE